MMDVGERVRNDMAALLNGGADPEAVLEAYWDAADALAANIYGKAWREIVALADDESETVH